VLQRVATRVTTSSSKEKVDTEFEGESTTSTGSYHTDSEQAVQQKVDT
jgi:hypothetical protein